MSLTGCLQQGSEPNTFKLTKVTSEHAKGTQGSELVVATAELTLSDHVGHKGRGHGHDFWRALGELRVPCNSWYASATSRRLPAVLRIREKLAS